MSLSSTSGSDPTDRDHIEDVHYNEELEELMTKYKENQAMAAKMFEAQEGSYRKANGR